MFPLFIIDLCRTMTFNSRLYELALNNDRLSCICLQNKGKDMESLFTYSSCSLYIRGMGLVQSIAGNSWGL